MEIVDEIEPIGINECCRVASTFNEYGSANHCPLRDVESVKGNLDRLANTKKETGDLSCPAPVCRAKQIARAILGKGNEISVGEDT